MAPRPRLGYAVAAVSLYPVAQTALSKHMARAGGSAVRARLVAGGVRLQHLCARADGRVLVGDASEAQMEQKRTVLVVEDSPEVQAVEVVILRDLGCVPCVARDALEALALVRSLGGRVSLVLADLDIGPFDGLELAYRLAETVPHLGVILSCCNQEDLHGRPLPPNIRGILVKPFELGAMTQMIREALPPAGAEA